MIQLAIYVAGFILCYRVAYRFLDDDLGPGSADDKFDRALPAVFAFLLSSFWPLILAGWAVWRIATPKTARQRRAELQAMEQRRDELQEDIRRKERQLGIGEEER